MERHLYYC